MTENSPALRRFRVHAHHIDRHSARALTEQSCEAAAVAYVEDYPFVFGDSPEISVIVFDIDTGYERCFRIDLNSGDASPCN